MNRELSQDAVDQLVERAAAARFTQLVPTQTDVSKIHAYIMKYIKDRKLIVYGGMSLDLLEKKSGRAGLYSSPPTSVDAVPDIEVYSPTPLQDAFNMVNHLFENEGMENMQAVQALHQGTYTIKHFVVNYCDISYVPQHVFNCMPTQECKGFKLVAQEVPLIDMYLIRTNVLVDHHRLTKVFERQPKAEQHLSPRLKQFWSNKDDAKALKVFEKHGTPTRGEVVKQVLKALKNHAASVLVGVYGLKLLLQQANHPQLKPVPSTMHADAVDVLCVNAAETYQLVQHALPDTTARERTPFMDVLPASVELVHNNNVVARFYQLANTCAPFHKLRDGKWLVAGLDQFYNFWLAKHLFATVHKDKKCLRTSLNVLRLLRQAQRLETPDETSKLADGPFQILRLQDCLGPLEDIRVAKQREFRKKKKLNKENVGKKNKTLVFRYSPLDKLQEKAPNFIFPNVSGNLVKHEKNNVIVVK